MPRSHRSRKTRGGRGGTGEGAAGGGGAGGSSTSGSGEATAAAAGAAAGPTCAALLEKAAEFAAKEEVELACKFYERALEAEPGNAEAMDAYAALLLDAGDAETAESLLVRSTEVAPGAGASKWLYLGQLRNGSAAAEAYRRGIAILEAELRSSGTDNQRRGVARRQLSSALCSVAELYMTDLCDEPEAHEQCEQCVQDAVKYDEANPEAHQMTAQLRIVEGRREEAKASILRTVELLNALEDAEEELPPYLMRLAAARILVELDAAAEATVVLDRLLAEDDTVMEVWFLMGEVQRNAGQFSVAIEYLERASEMLRAVAERSGLDEEQAAEAEQIGKLLELVRAESAEHGGDAPAGGADDAAM